MAIISFPLVDSGDRAGYKNGKPKKRIACPKCPITLSRRSDLRRHDKAMHGDKSLDKPFKCNFDDCSYSDHQRSNLAVHMSKHTSNKKYKCEWHHYPAGAPCEFGCTDPSSLNRHTKRHVEKAMLKGEPIKEKYQKYVRRICSKIENSANATRNSPSPTPVPDTKIDVVSDSDLGTMNSPLVAADTPIYISPETTPSPIAMEQRVLEQPQSQQNFTVDKNFNDISTGFFSGVLDFGQSGSQRQSQPTLTEQLSSNYLKVVKRMEQLMPILAKAQRELSPAEMKGVICYIVWRRDGFSAEQFFD